MKALLDRQTCLLRNFVDTLNPTSLIDGRRMAMVMTAQGPIEENADLLVRAGVRKDIARLVRDARS